MTCRINAWFLAATAMTRAVQGVITTAKTITDRVVTDPNRGPAQTGLRRLFGCSVMGQRCDLRVLPESRVSESKCRGDIYVT